ISRTHNYLDGPNTYPVSVKVTDSMGATVTGGFQVTVNNVAPTVALTGNNSVNETGTYTLTVSGYTDPGPDTPTAVVINWGDGNTTPLSSTDVTNLRSGGSVVLTHPYGDGPNNYTITASVTDEDGTFNPAGSKSITVANVAPTVTLAGNSTTAEGALYSLTVSGYTDPGPDTPTAVVINWGDGSTPLTSAQVASLFGGTPVTVPHTCADGPNNFTITATITDEDGTFPNAGSQAVTVTNVAPTIAISGPASVNEGSPYSLTLGAVTDPGTDTVSTYVVHWGDGAINSYTAAQVALAGRVVTHPYADGPNSY